MPITERHRDHPPPLFILELRLRLEGCLTEQEKRQRLAPLFRHWGKQAHIAIRDEPLRNEPERAALTLVICLESSSQAQQESDAILAWCERQLSAWVEHFQTQDV